MTSVSELLVISLKELRKDQLKEFQWRVRDRGGIPASELENADVFDTIDKMKGCYGPDEAVKVMLNILRKMNQNHVADRLEDKHAEMKGAVVKPSPEPQTRDQFLQCRSTHPHPQYFHHLTLDQNTVNQFLRLSEGHREITYIYPQEQRYPDHPDRFECYDQVLCRESVCGRSYWEMEWTGVYSVDISVSYKSIGRKGTGYMSRFGNEQSWSLFCTPVCSNTSYSFHHNNTQTKLAVKSRSDRIGVYVDHRAGILSFFSISDSMTLIHSISTTFTQPLYPGFGLYYSHTKVKLCDPTM